MEFRTLTIAAIPPPPQHHQLLSMCYLRGLFHQVKAFHFMLVLSCAFFCLATCEPCLIHGMQKSAEYDACGSYGDDCSVGFEGITLADTGSGYAAGSPMTHMNIENICTNSYSFCFPSTLPGFWSEELKRKPAALEVSRNQHDSPLSVGSTQGSRWATNQSWSSDSGMFEFMNGRIVSCYLNSRRSVDELSSMQNDSASHSEHSSCRGPLQTQKSTSFRLNKNSAVMKASTFDVSSSPDVEISPPVLDWGQKHLYFPSVASLTVANTCNESILHVYEPFSTNNQFYPCNFSEFVLGPGEVASICFVFLPRWLGLSSAHLILQTSSGGFLVLAKGYAVESPYKISPLLGLGVPSSGQLSQNLSLLNPFNETLYVKEVSAWILVSQGNISHNTEATCSLENIRGSDDLSLLSVNSWLAVKGGPVDFPLMAMRPHENWEIGPQSSDTIIEIEFSPKSLGKIFGAFCMQLLRSSQDKSDTVVVPFEVDLSDKVAYDGIAGSISVSLEALVPCDASNAVFVAIYLRNRASHVLKVVKISEVALMKVFQMKYIEGLALFPGTVTQVATVTCTQLLVELHDSPPEMSNVDKNCKLDVLTNDSISPQIEISCQDIIHFCVSHQKDSSTKYDHQSVKSESGNRRTGSLGNDMQSPLQIKALEAEADEFVLGNWKSQGTSSGMSVLDDHEVLFPKVQVGSHCSKWITVKNPSEQPVVMQLILNSGEIIDECNGTDSFMEAHPSSSLVHTGFNLPSRYGFSMAESAVTEAYVHPYGKTSFGPIFFRPSNRCGWRSSALIRNNLSGVEWLSLRGFGGLLSLVLLEGSEPVQSIEFNFNSPLPRNMSPVDMFFHMKEITHACSQPLSKELYAKNMGDLPLEVKTIEVSGKGCGLDGFMVHTCKGFSLEPGESMKLLLSYQTDFSAAMVRKDLELVLAGGMLMIPMRASLPLYMFNLCKKTVFWLRLKKFSAVVLLAALLMFLIFCCVFHQMITLGFQDYVYKSEKSSSTAVQSAGKSACLHCNQRKSKVSMSTEMDGLRTVGEEKTLKRASVGRYSESQDGAGEQGITTQNVTPTLGSQKQTNILLYTQKDKAAPSLLSKSVAHENSDILEASQPCNLTVRTGKEKGRKRRKRRGVSVGLTGLFEVSSSQSGNSTPSSPLSPLTSVTPNCASSPSPDIDLVEARSPFGGVANQQCEKVQASEPMSKGAVLEPKISLKCNSNNGFSAAQEQPSAPRKTSKPVLLPSATFPSAGKDAPNLQYTSCLASTSTIAPHARAPGPKVYNQRTVQLEERVGDDYAYDIWGDHFSGLHLVGSSKDVTTMKAMARENNSNSFFVRGPQALVRKSQPKSCICFENVN